MSSTITSAAVGAESSAPTAARTGAVAFTHARTWLLRSPLIAAAEYPADVLVLDLEDGLPAARKAEGRERALWMLLGSAAGAWLRISPPGTADGLADLDLCRRAGDALGGVVLAMCGGPDDVERVSAVLGDEVPIVPMIESAAALLAAPGIAAHPRTARLAFGTGDFRRDTGMAADRMALAWPRAQLTVASAAAGLPGPIDGPCGDVAAARDAADHALAMGFTGTLALDPAAVAGAHAGFTPSPAAIAQARELAEATPAGDVDGSYAPALARARALLARAAALGAL
ncbi:HpcH/HpaI aldolase/citrate lyase family protein [Microbacterium hatanonis]|uniref:HpcH/HpaI aldolase/citrate lyase domain-containing protein n=1 Tax=Microbacterium hatanonis TaxID=404366 RepID=A0A5C8HXZ1_9MICO|nr:aldolase/citrate lyase family protein [Microbacterium hatanonis]TXK09955.1 hypothetical protein FVP77_13835 [Microbacterium hatanonis]